jgi:hypothetical protein
MTENMASFNSETGEFEITAEARQQLSFAAEQLGLAKDNVIDMAFQSNKMKDIKLSVGGDFTEEQLDKITSIAKFKDGQWKVDVEGDSISVDELSTDQLEKALATPTDEKDATIITAKAAMTTNELLDALVKSNEVAIIRQTKIYETLERGLDPLVKSVSETNKTLVSQAGEAMKESGFGKKLDEMVKFATNQFNSASEGVAFFNQALIDFKNANLLLGQKQGASGRAPKNMKPRKDATVRPVLNTGGDIASFDPGDEFLIGKSGGPLSRYLAEMNEKLNKTIATPTVPSVNTPQKIDVGGELTLPPLEIRLNGLSETTKLSPNIEQMIFSKVISLFTSGDYKYADGKTPGKDALVWT